MSVASDLERQMLDLINAERAAHGLDALELELRLNDSAEDHSSWMLATDTFSHTGVGNSNPGDRMRDADFEFSGSWSWGENVAWQSVRGAPGYADDVVNLHDALMNSPGHRANILNSGFELIGIGIEIGNFNGWNAVMVTQNFARTGAVVQIDTGTAPPNDPPVVTVGDITLAKVAGEKRTKLEDHLQVTDGDGDPILWYELKDNKGRDNFRFKGEGNIDADTPFRVDADDLDMIRVRMNKKIGDTKLKIRASDGEDVGAWETIELSTLSELEWNALI